MTAIILTSGLSGALERDIEAIAANAASSSCSSSPSGDAAVHEWVASLKGTPLPLLPLRLPTTPQHLQGSDECHHHHHDRQRLQLVDAWYGRFKQDARIRHVFLVVEPIHTKWYERWATSRGFPLERVLSNGRSSSSHGAYATAFDVEMVLRTQREQVDEGDSSCSSSSSSSSSFNGIVVVSADLLVDRDFSLSAALDYYTTLNNSSSNRMVQRPYFNLAGHSTPSQGSVGVIERTRLVEHPKHTAISSVSDATTTGGRQEAESDDNKQSTNKSPKNSKASGGNKKSSPQQQQRQTATNTTTTTTTTTTRKKPEIAVFSSGTRIADDVAVIARFSSSRSPLSSDTRKEKGEENSDAEAGDFHSRQRSVCPFFILHPRVAPRLHRFVVEETRREQRLQEAEEEEQRDADDDIVDNHVEEEGVKVSYSPSPTRRTDNDNNKDSSASSSSPSPRRQPRRSFDVLDVDRSIGDFIAATTACEGAQPSGDHYHHHDDGDDSMLKWVPLRLPNQCMMLGCAGRGRAWLQYEHCVLLQQQNQQVQDTGSSLLLPQLSNSARNQISSSAVVTRKSYARVGLMGNPSDQMHGKSIGVTVSNFWATATIRPSASCVRLVPHPLHDPHSFGSLQDLFTISAHEGYSGGLRLLQATCKRFAEYCAAHGINLPDRRFELSYDTNVPRQVGLAGSSCIVSAVVKALMAFFGLTYDDIPKQLVPSLVLAVESEELSIHAGLMDRVAQVYQGLVHMDFSEVFLAQRGHGVYTALDVALLPPLHLAYARDPSDSGKIHNNVKQKWSQGDATVLQAVQLWRGFVDEAVAVLHEGDKSGQQDQDEGEEEDEGGNKKMQKKTKSANHVASASKHKKFCDLIDMNFDLRRSIYGEQCLGWKNLRMIEIARAHAAAAKFPGSGGAILVCCRPHTDVLQLRFAFEAENFVFVRLDVVE